MLPGWIAVCPVMLPGREARMGERALESVGSIVQRLQATVGERLAERPYAVFGHSMGSLLAFEWVRAVAAAGLPGPLRLFCSGREGPQFGGGALAELGEEALLTGLAARYGAEASALLEDAEMRATFLPVLRADLRVVERYRMQAGAHVGCGISAFAGKRDGSVSDAGLRGWAAVSKEPFRTARFPGGHFYTLGEGQAELLARLQQELAALTGEERPDAWAGKD